MNIDVVSQLEQWARWRSNGCRAIYGGGVPCMTGKLLAGMGTSICHVCKGEGRAPGFRVGVAAAFVDPCPQCSGWGRTRSGDLDAMKRTRTIDCPDCQDAFGVAIGEVNGRTCITCKGSKRKQLVLFFQVNPASISTTRFVGANEDDDPISQMIDRTVAGWQMRDETLWFYIVTVVEYAIGGTQQYKADSAQRYFRRLTNYRSRSQMSQAWYSKNLKMAHTIIERKLQEMICSQS